MEIFDKFFLVYLKGTLNILRSTLALLTILQDFFLKNLNFEFTTIYKNGKFFYFPKNYQN